jgi:four helix bundle protein
MPIGSEAMRIQRFEDLYAWQQARRLVGEVYRFCASGAAARDFGYRNQICRASVSVMTNIAEGFSRRSKIEFGRYLDISRASAREVQSLLYVGRDLEYIDESTFTNAYRAAADTASTIGRLITTIPQSMSK